MPEARAPLSENVALYFATALRRRWEIGGGTCGSGKPGYWYPVHGSPSRRRDILALDADYVDASRFADIRQILSRRGCVHAYALREFGDIFALDIRCMEPEYDGTEGYWFSPRMDWLIYASHESSLTFGGKWLVRQIKKRWIGWEHNVWKPWSDRWNTREMGARQGGASMRNALRAHIGSDAEFAELEVYGYAMQTHTDVREGTWLDARVNARFSGFSARHGISIRVEELVPFREHLAGLYRRAARVARLHCLEPSFQIHLMAHSAGHIDVLVRTHYPLGHGEILEGRFQVDRTCLPQIIGVLDQIIAAFPQGG